MEKKIIRLQSSLTPAFTMMETADASYIRHSHSMYELIYLLDGMIELYVQDEQYTLHPGDMALIPGNQVHGFYTPDHSHSFIGAFHSDEIPEFQRLAERHHLLSPYIPSCEETQDFPDLFRKILMYSTAKDSLLISVGYLHILLGRLVPLLRFENNLPDSSALSLANQAILYIGDNIEKNITLESVAEHLNISKFYLSRIFNQQLNVSFNNYVSFLRINAGKRLLVQTDLQIGEIAVLCGFDSVRSFNRTFREYAGQTPTAYRNDNKGKLTVNYANAAYMEKYHADSPEHEQ